MMKLSIGYPDVKASQDMAKRFIEGQLHSRTVPVLNAKEVTEMQNEVKQVSIHANLLTYAAEIVDMTRNKAEIACGASPRAFLSMLRCAQALACMDERTYCIPEDIAESASLTIPHRLILTNGAKLSRITKEDLVKTILGQVKVQ